MTAYYEAIEASDIDKAMTFVFEDYVMTELTGLTVGKDGKIIFDGTEDTEPVL